MVSRGYSWRLGNLTASLVVVTILAGGARADDEAHFRINGDGGAIAHPPTATSEAEDETPSTRMRRPEIDHRSIILDLDKIRCPSFGDEALVNQIAPECDAPGSIIRMYHGVQSIAVRRLLGYYRRIFTTDLKNHISGSNSAAFDLDDRIQRMADAENDLRSGGRWWERTWRQSLLPQCGGAPALPRIETVGAEIEIFRLGEIVITNEGRLKVGRLSLYLDDDRIYERIEEKTRDALFAASRRGADPGSARAAAAPADKDRTEKPQKAFVTEENRVDLTLGLFEDDAAIDLERVLAGTARDRSRPAGGRFKTPRGNLVTGDGWNMSLTPNISLRLPDNGGSLPGAVSNAELVLDVNLYPGETRQLWGILSFKVAASPRDQNNVTASAEILIVRW
jgi:hypothetical protein